MLKNKKIFVVGAGGLLGSSLVAELIKKEATVVAADIDVKRLEERLDAMILPEHRGRIETHQLDLSNKNNVVDVFSKLEGITGAVNCSYPRNKNYGNHFYSVQPEDFNENVSLNLGSSFIFMQQCAKYFQNTKMPFSLVNIASVYGVVAPKFEIYDNTPMTMPVEYAAIKAGLIHLSKYVATYVSDSRFRVNVVSPGGIFDSQPQEFLNAYKTETFGKGMLDVTDVLGSIIFLLSPMAEYVNGQNIIVDDGFSL